MYLTLKKKLNAALRRDVMCAKLERSENGTRCGIALKHFVMYEPTVGFLVEGAYTWVTDSAFY